MIATRTTVALGTMLLLSAAGRPAHAAYTHVDALGLEVQHQAEVLLGQFRTQLLDAPQFSELTADAYQAYRRGGHIREVARLGGSMRYVRSDVHGLRTLIGDMERLILEAEISAAQGQFGSGRDIDSAVRFVRSYLHKMDSAASQLQAAADAMLQPVGHTVYVPETVVISNPVVVPRPIVVRRPIVRPRRVYRRHHVHHHHAVPFAIRFHP